MTIVVLVIHLLLALSLIGLVLLQRSEGGGLGIGSSGGGGGGMGGFMTGRSTANLLTRATAGVAAAFMVTSMTLAILAGGTRERGSILDQPGQQQEAPAPDTGPDTAPQVPQVPSGE